MDMTLSQHAAQRHANPLLDFTGLPRFDQIQPSDVTPASDELLTDARAVVARITASDAEATWDSVVEPLNEVTDLLARSWGAVSHMNAVVDTPELREQYNANLPKLTEFWTALSQNEALYEKFKALAATPEFSQWPGVRRKVLENELRDFRLGGVELAADKKERFKQVRERESQVSTRFAENVLDATNAFALYIDNASALAGVPPDAMQMLAEAAHTEGKTGYKISLQYPSYSAIVDYAHDRALRQQMYRAYSTRASEFGNPDWNNGPLMMETLKLRREHAQYSVTKALPKCRWWRKWPRVRRMYSSSCAISRGARSPTRSATSPSCASLLRSISASPSCSRGTCRTRARSCASSAIRIPSRS